MIRSAWILILCSVLTYPALGHDPAETAEAQIKKASDRFWASRGDAAVLAAQLTETVILMVPGLPDAVGREEVRDLLHQRFTALRPTDLKTHNRELDVAGDTAYELTVYSEKQVAQGEAMRLDGRYLIVWKRGADGVWRAHRILFNYSGATPL
jgi:ketosteroid isomerase-like protein